MKRIAAAALALALAPAAAFAQSTPPPGQPPVPGAPAPNPARFAAMQQLRQTMLALRRQSRVQMLASLTPQHRAQLATLIGAYAVSPTPDPAGLARQIDGLLSKNELQSVINVAASERASARGVMVAARAQMESTLSADEKAAIDAREQQRASRHAGHQRPPQDPGRELLHTLLDVGGREGGPHGGPGMGRPPM
jgi:hypothetical protein